MSNEKYQCARCSIVLPSKEAICPSCDDELAHSPYYSDSPDSSKTPFNSACPVCRNYVENLDIVWLPKNAAWYQPTAMHYQCPICKIILRKKYESKGIKFIYFLIWMVFSTLLSRFQRSELWYLLFFSLSCFVLPYFSILTHRAACDPVKYIPDESFLPK